MLNKWFTPQFFFFYGSIQSFVHFSFNSYTVGCWYSQNAPESCSPSDWPDTPCNGKAQRNSMKVIHFKKFPCKTSLGWREVCEARPSPWNCWTQLGENRKSCLFFFFSLLWYCPFSRNNLFSISLPMLQLYIHQFHEVCHTPFSSYWTENLVPRGSWVAKLCIEISQPKHIKERGVIFHRDESTSSSLSI